MAEEVERIFQAVIGIFIIAVFLGAILPAMQQISPISTVVFSISMILLLITVILPLFRRG